MARAYFWRAYLLGLVLAVFVVIPRCARADVSYTLERDTYGRVPYATEVGACDAGYVLLVAAVPSYASYHSGVVASRCLVVDGGATAGQWELLGAISSTGAGVSSGSGGVVSMAPFDFSSEDGLLIASAIAVLWMVAFGFRQIFNLLKGDKFYEQD